MTILTRAFALALLASVACGARADYQVSWYSINSGGGLATGGAYRLTGSVGQSAAGVVRDVSLVHWIGFWAGGTPNPTVAPTVSAAKMLPDGVLASISGKVATSAVGDFAEFIYVEEEDRSSGIRIAVPPGSIPDLARGSVVNVIGTLGTTADGERQFTGPTVVVISSTTPPRPLGMCNRFVGGGDFGAPPAGQYGVEGGYGLNNVGLLIETWGRVTGAGTGYVVIDDGSGTPVRLDTTTLASPPALNSYVSVIGVSSLCRPADKRLPVVLPRGDGDILP